MALGTPTSIGVNSFSGTVSGSSITMTTSAAITAGNLVVLIIALGSTSAPSVSSISDGTNSYTKAWGTTTGTNVTLECWYKENASGVGSGATVTATLSGAMSGASEGWVLHGFQVAGAKTSASLDVAPAPSTSNSTTPSVATGTLAQANEIVFAASYNNNGNVGYTESSGFTNLYSGGGAIGKSVGIGYKITSVTTTSTYQPTWASTAAINMITGLASFKEAATAAIVTNFRMPGL
jgi:hypothetical protein